MRRDDIGRYREGEHYIIDDRTGLKIRASDAVKEWTGAMVHHKFAEARHPQDFVRALADDQTVANPRPKAVDTFIGPLTTRVVAAAAAGAINVDVDSTIRMAAGDFLQIMLDTNDNFRVAIQGIQDATTLTLAHPLPASISVGAMVIDATAMSEPTLG